MEPHRPLSRRTKGEGQRHAWTEIKGLQFFRGPVTLGGSTTPMKKLVLSALVLMAGSLLFTSCTSVPQDKPQSSTTTTTVPQDNK